jgi:hypothetical protein
MIGIIYSPPLIVILIPYSHFFSRSAFLICLFIKFSTFLKTKTWLAAAASSPVRHSDWDSLASLTASFVGADFGECNMTAATNRLHILL